MPKDNQGLYSKLEVATSENRSGGEFGVALASIRTDKPACRIRNGLREIDLRFDEFPKFLFRGTSAEE